MNVGELILKNEDVCESSSSSQHHHNHHHHQQQLYNQGQEEGENGFHVEKIEEHYLDEKDKQKDLTCKICGKLFQRQEHLIRHFRVHSGEKPFACDFPGCTKRFSRKDNLSQHQKCHTSNGYIARRSNYSSSSDFDTEEGWARLLETAKKLEQEIEEAPKTKKRRTSGSFFFSFLFFSFLFFSFLFFFC
jgi:uncharacterized Zn-finger protein